MPSFRAKRSSARRSTEAVLHLDDVRQVIEEVWRPAHFFARSHLHWQHSACEEVPWEVYQGRLLDSAHCWTSQTFEVWNIFWTDDTGRSTEPILSLKLDMAIPQVHVTRALHCYAWEGYNAGGDVYLSRETRKWIRELVGTVHLQRFCNVDDVRDELICLLFQAVVGSSRLPLTSVEAPLPAFSLGELAYFHRPQLAGAQASQPMTTSRDLVELGLHRELSWLEKAKLLETLLRTISTEGIGEAAKLFAQRWSELGHSSREFVALCRTLFNEVALSPYTNFVDNFLAFLRILLSYGPVQMEEIVDLLSYLLRQTARHLTAYDLITFHHRGANYPDALLLDAVLRAYLTLIEGYPELFMPTRSDDGRAQWHKRLRRRALRQGWLLWHFYEGLLVPDAPTSAGENARILPPPHIRVPEEQILVPAKRSKRLFAGKPLGYAGDCSRKVMRLAVDDLQLSEELQELGMAVFLDRPLGAGKAPAQPDRTLLMSYEAFSRSLAQQRLRYLAQDLRLIPNRKDFETHLNILDTMLVQGIPVRATQRHQRPGTVSLDDATRVAEDFLLLRTTRQTLQDFFGQFDFAPLAARFKLEFLDPGRRLLIVRAISVDESKHDVLIVYDANLQRRLELEIDSSSGYRSRAGIEYPAAGLRVLRVWEMAGDPGEMQELSLPGESLIIAPRS